MEGHPARPHVAIHSVGAPVRRSSAITTPANQRWRRFIPTSHGKRPRQGPFVWTILGEPLS